MNPNGVASGKRFEKEEEEPFSVLDPDGGSGACWAEKANRSSSADGYDDFHKGSVISVIRLPSVPIIDFNRRTRILGSSEDFIRRVRDRRSVTL